MTAGTVVEVTEVLVEAPLIDRAPASVRRLGAFQRLADALEWLSRRIERRGHPRSGSLLYYRLDMVVLEEAAPRVAYTVVFDGDDRRRGIIDGDREKPWGGRDPLRCKFRCGDLVGFLSPYEDKYRVGVVLAQPPTPEAARRQHLTVGDDRYLVGMLDENGGSECSDHAHVFKPLLFPVVHEVAPDVRAALQKRAKRYGR